MVSGGINTESSSSSNRSRHTYIHDEWQEEEEEEEGRVLPLPRFCFKRKSINKKIIMTIIPTCKILLPKIRGHLTAIPPPCRRRQLSRSENIYINDQSTITDRVVNQLDDSVARMEKLKTDRRVENQRKACMASHQTYVRVC